MAPTGDNGAFTFGTLDFSNLQIALNFLKTKSDAKVISSPRIVTVDNKEARIQVGETRRIRSSATVNTETNITEYDYEATDVGIILTVTPHITPDGHVRLNLQPEVSSADEVDENNINIINKRVAQTEVIIKDARRCDRRPGGKIKDRNLSKCSLRRYSFAGQDVFA